jgi:hypothetical protein
MFAHSFRHLNKFGMPVALNPQQAERKPAKKQGNQNEHAGNTVFGVGNGINGAAFGSPFAGGFGTRQNRAHLRGCGFVLCTRFHGR